MKNSHYKEILDILNIAQYEHLSNKDSREIYQEILLGLNKILHVKFSALFSCSSLSKNPEILSVAHTEKVQQPYWHDLSKYQDLSWESSLLETLLIEKDSIQGMCPLALRKTIDPPLLGNETTLFIPITYGSQPLGFMVLVAEKEKALLDTLHILQTVCYFIGSFIYIRETEKKKIKVLEDLKAQQKLLENFIHTLPVAVCILDQKFNYLDSSKMWQSLFSVHEQEKVLHDTLPKKYFSKVYTLLEETEKTREPQTIEIEKSINQSKLSLFFKAAIWVDSYGRVGGIILFCEDRTNEKALRQQLSDNIHRLKETNQQLDYFATVCAHDLREPLRSISNYSQLLSEENVKKNEKDHLLKEISSKCKNLNSLINSILNYSRLGRDSILIESINLSALKEDTNKEISTLITEKHAEIRLDSSPSQIFYADYIQIKQLMMNLFINAIKYSRKNPIIAVNLKENTSYYLLCIKDNGIGFKSEEVRRMNAFFRGKEINPHGLKGIGFMIISKIVKNHHGHIRLYSTPNEGSTFYFIFPKQLSN